MENTGIPQIRPKSILDPPQIHPETEVDEGIADSPDIMNSNQQTENLNSNKKGVKSKRFKLNFNFKSKKRKRLGAVIVVLSVILLALIVVPGYMVYRSGKTLVAGAHELKASAATQDINLVEAEVAEFKTDLADFRRAYNRIVWLKYTPFLGVYVRDGQSGLNAANHGIDTLELVISTIKPYADIIGFAGSGSPEPVDGENTANDRIDFLVRSIEDILPRMDEIAEKAGATRDELSHIDPARYPEEFRGVAVRSQLTKALDLVNEGANIMVEGKPFLESAPYLLGIDEERTYLILFQNDKELRPTGGFITAYSIMNVRNGKVQPVNSSDIYSLDAQYTPNVAAPDELRNYLAGEYVLLRNYHLRDMNWSPDFRTSIELFMSEAGKAGIEEVDGVIAVDTQVVVYLLDVLGEIGVPGFGNFSTNNDPRCDCPQVIYELESFADNEGPIVWSENEPGKIVFAPPNYDNRKKIVGPLMNSVLTNALGQPKDKLPELFEAAWKSVTEKHALIYLFDENAQSGAEAFNIAGRIKDYEGDYLHISDANLGGRKSNLYVAQEVAQVVSTDKDGRVEKTLTITYKNPQPHDGWLNSVLPNWTRIYVPQGSELISLDGFDDTGEVYEELGKTVFSGGFRLRPEGVKRITVKYKLPFTVNKSYKMLIQKQPGTHTPLHTIKVGKSTEELFLKTDKEFEFAI